MGLHIPSGNEDRVSPLQAVTPDGKVLHLPKQILSFIGFMRLWILVVQVVAKGMQLALCEVIDVCRLNIWVMLLGQSLEPSWYCQAKSCFIYLDML